MKTFEEWLQTPEGRKVLQEIDGMPFYTVTNVLRVTYNAALYEANNTFNKILDAEMAKWQEKRKEQQIG